MKHIWMVVVSLVLSFNAFSNEEYDAIILEDARIGTIGCIGDEGNQRCNGGGGGGGGGGTTNTLTLMCESVDFQDAFCNLPSGLLGVNLLEQVSDATCTDKYGLQSNNLIVIDGCRGRFSAVLNRMVTVRRLTCSSINNTLLRGCGRPIGGNNLIWIEERHSDAHCERNVTWGVDGLGIWVDGGCRATFASAL